jgi:hypothetical protein
VLDFSLQLLPEIFFTSTNIERVTLEMCAELQKTSSGEVSVIVVRL